MYEISITPVCSAHVCVCVTHTTTRTEILASASHESSLFAAKMMKRGTGQENYSLYCLDDDLNIENPESRFQNTASNNLIHHAERVAKWSRRRKEIARGGRRKEEDEFHIVADAPIALRHVLCLSLSPAQESFTPAAYESKEL